MNYKSVLYNYEPIQKGDFMLYYETDQEFFVLYSPEKNRISCLDVTFRDITPFELAVRLNIPIKEVVISDEFDFVVCEKSNLIKYLFDIEELVGDSVICRVSDQEGIILHDLSNTQKSRNIFMFDPITKKFKMRFNNESCIASFNEDKENADIAVCWNPLLYNTLKISLNDEYTVYLLPASSLPLSGYVFKKFDKKKLNKIVLYINYEDVTNVFLFISHYCQFFGHPDMFYFTSGKITHSLLLKQWNPIRVMNMLSKAQKKCNDQLKALYNSFDEKNLSIYQCESFKEDTLVYFSNNNHFTYYLLQTLIKEVELAAIDLQFL
jgi:hypothetical protein